MEFSCMSTQDIAQTLARQDKRVTSLEAKVKAKPASKGGWRDAIGFAKGDKLFAEAMDLGAEWRGRANKQRR